MRADLHLDSVTLSRSGQAVVNPVLLDQRILHDTRRVIAAHVHPFTSSTLGAGVVNVSTAHCDIVHAASKVDTDVNVVNDQIVEGNVREGALHRDSVSTAGTYDF